MKVPVRKDTKQLSLFNMLDTRSKWACQFPWLGRQKTVYLASDILLSTLFSKAYCLMDSTLSHCWTQVSWDINGFLSSANLNIGYTVLDIQWLEFIHQSQIKDESDSGSLNSSLLKLFWGPEFCICLSDYIFLRFLILTSLTEQLQTTHWDSEIRLTEYPLPGLVVMLLATKFKWGVSYQS